MKISKGNLHLSKATVAYTLQIDTAREPLTVYTTAITKGKTPVPVCLPKLSPVGRG